MKNNYSRIACLSMLAAALCPLGMKAEWGTPETPSVIFSEIDTEVSVMKTARTADGKTFVSWLEWGADGGYDICLQLVDQNGEFMWSDGYMVVEDKPNAGWTADYWMVVTPEGDAIISWADARHEEGAEFKYGHEPVLYKVSQDQEMLWGDDGITLGDEYRYPPTLYQFGNDTYCLMLSADDYGPTKITRLNEDGSFAFEPKVFYGELIASEGTDFLSFYSGSEGTMAMRYTRDIQPVWDQPAILSTYIYTGYARQAYQLVSDGEGGAVVSFSRDLNMFSQIPVVAYVTADGEAVFGESADVVAIEEGNHEYGILAVNTESETIFSAWAMSLYEESLGGQMMDYFGERLWGPEGKRLASKESDSGYGFGPIAAYPLSDDRWFVTFADEQWWGHNILYFNIYDSEGNLLESRCGTEATVVNDYSTYMDGNDFYMFYINEYSDDDWVNHCEITTVKVTFTETGIESTQQNPSVCRQTEYYDLNGRRTLNPGKGVYIVKDADGTAKKAIL